MSDRLQELLRQKALLDQHRAWLEREIAAEQAASGATPSAQPPVAPAAPPFPPPAAIATDTPAPSAVDDSAAAIIEQYETSPKTIHQDVKRGCFLYFAAALALFALGVVAIFYYYRSR